VVRINLVPLQARLTQLPRTTKRAIALGADLAATALALALSGALVLGDRARDQLPLAYLAIAPLTAIPAFVKFGLYRAVIRYIGTKALAAVVAGVSISVVLLGVIDALSDAIRLPVAVFAMYWSFALIYVAGSRFIARVALNREQRNGARVAVYGAGKAGALLASALRNAPEFTPVAFVDDDEGLVGSFIGGLEVSAVTELPRLAEQLGVSEVLLAIPSASRQRRREILAGLEGLGLRVRTIPDLSEIAAGRAQVGELREVQASDLLGRDAVVPHEGLLRARVDGKAVLVTGAGGSIGSELCRQVVKLQPRRLVLVDQSEPALYQVERELQKGAQESGSPLEITALLGNAADRFRMREVFETFAVQTVYHAAAYKHVPIVEENAIAGIANNAMATWRIADAAREAEVETFVLISTDKAVNPTSVMGATKRLAELIVQALHAEKCAMRCCIVRFGNVLESSGSVVPLFREQIAAGGPVTVTHPDIIRYFMTIEEAASVVIQASALATGGEVFLLDMGEPVRIRGLARRMIHLSGLSVRDADNPDGDIEIQYTGLRPAEKLKEELLVSPNSVRTQHPMIMRAVEAFTPWDQLRRILLEIDEALRVSNVRRALELLSKAVPEYAPSLSAGDVVAQERAGTSRLSVRPRARDADPHGPRVGTTS